MNSILAKFRRVIRYGVAASLPAVSCFSSYAYCTASYDAMAGGWWVSCDFSDSFFVDGPAPGEGGGSCTNCTAMSPSECQSVKNSIISICSSLSSQVSSLIDQANSLYVSLDDSDRLIGDLIVEGDSFSPARSFNELGSTNDERLGALRATSQAPYLYDSGSSAQRELYVALGGVGSIYNYYNERVRPSLESLHSQVFAQKSALEVLRYGLDDLDATVPNLLSVGESMNCAACEGSGGGGGGGGSGGGGTTPSGCPCSEYINAVKDAVYNCKYKLDDIYEKLTSVKSRLDEWNNTVKKFSSFMDYVKAALPTLAYMGTNFVYATDYRKTDGSSYTMKDIHARLTSQTNSFDFTTFGSLSWFSCIEYLLLNLNGFFGEDSSQLDQSAAESVIRQADEISDSRQENQDELDGHFEHLKEVSPSSVFGDKIMTVLRQFKDSFSVSQQPSWSQMYMLEGNFDDFGFRLNGTFRVKAFNGTASEATDTFLNLIRRVCQFIYSAAAVYLGWLLFVSLWSRVVSFFTWAFDLFSGMFN